MDTAVLISCMALTGTLLIVLLLLCRLVQPHDIAWFLSNREDKLKLSKMRLYNANGYLMHSGSEILLGSTGSFKRFDSVDRDYKPQYGPRQGIPPWRNSTEEPDIPPQPLRPAPSPREAKLLREKPIHRQISEPKVPVSRSIIISPIPRPVPRKQHSAPISFPLPLLISPQDKRSSPALQEQPLPACQHHYSTNPFLSRPPLEEEYGEGGPIEETASNKQRQDVPTIPPPPLPLTVPSLPAVSRLPSPEFRALKSANNPFIDSPTTINKRHNQHHYQQQQQQSCVFNFDPARVQSLFNRQVPGGSLLLPNKASTTTTNTTTTSTTTTVACSVAVESPVASPPPAPLGEDDPLRRAHKRISKMENIRKMSRLIESNQLLLNIYQQFNRTIAEQPELPMDVTAPPSIPLLPSAGPAIARESTTSESESPALAHATPSVVAVDSSQTPAAALHAAASNVPSTCTTGKYRDSPRSDITDNIRVPTVSRSIKHILRNRSFSETEFSERKLIKTFAILSESDAALRAHSSPASASPSPLVKNASYKDLSRHQQRGSVGNVQAGFVFSYDTSDTLQKTVSESFLEQYSLARYNEREEVPRADGWLASGGECFRVGTVGKVLPSTSCESVASESSVVFTDLVPSPCQPVIGYLCVGLQFDKVTEDGKELLVTVQEAKKLVAPPGTVSMETFVKLFVTPDEENTRQTKVCKHSECASYQETFSFWMSKHKSPLRRSVWFYVYHNSVDSQTLIGEAELQIDENVQQPMTTWLKLLDSSYRRESLGELMLSLTYLPTAERLTVVVVKARKLALKNRSPVGVKRGDETDPPDKKDIGHESDTGGNVFVKVYLLQNDRKISKKKTSVKRAEQFPIYNEAIIFSLPAYMLNAVQIRLSVVQIVQRMEQSAPDPGLQTNRRESLVDGFVVRKPSVKLISLGHVIVGSGTTGKGLRHWHQMLTALRKPVTMWHGLRSTSERKRRHNHADVDDVRINVSVEADG